MAQQLQTISLIAPGFLGINTEDSPLGQEPTYAGVADNAVIDKFGRLAARMGNEVQTTTKTELGSATIEAIHQFEDSAGNQQIFSVGNNKILSGTATLVDESPGSYTITDDNWKIVNFNDGAYFFQRGYEPLVYTNTLGAVTKMSSVAGWAAPSGKPFPEGHAVVAALSGFVGGSFS